MERLQAYEMIDEAGKGTVFFRIIINPDPATEDTHKDLSLPEITGKTMQTLQERVGSDVPYIAATHADHTPLHHVHILALVKGRLGKEDFQALRQTATHAALQQRKERDLAQEQQQKGAERQQ
jgi:hypothetical protein